MTDMLSHGGFEAGLPVEEELAVGVTDGRRQGSREACPGAQGPWPRREHDLAQVLGEWRMRPGGGRGRGVTALFAGDSGTGKTMAAEVIAAERGLDLYAVDLAGIVDKYVGETEKNLEKIFAGAARRERGAALRRGGRDLRQALGGTRRR